MLDLIVGAVKPEIIDLTGAAFLSIRNHVLDHGFAFGIFNSPLTNRVRAESMHGGVVEIET